MPELKEDQVPVMFIELVEKGDSGFVQDGTEGTPFEVRLTAPSITWIPTDGWRKQKNEKDEKGNLLKPFNERIKYISSEREISVKKQKELGIEPTRGGKGDKIIFEKGFFTIAREEPNIGLYDYLKESFYNQNNPDRSPKATAIYKVIEPDLNAEVFNEDEMASADAIQYIGTLYAKVGDRQYKYNEEKINGLCSLLNIYAETNAGKIQSIITIAKSNPRSFMNVTVRWEQTTETEITHALSLNVVKFEKNVFMYVAKDKVIKSLGTENLKQNQKITKAADWLRTSDGHEAYMELKAELEAAQEKQLQS